MKNQNDQPRVDQKFGSESNQADAQRVDAAYDPKDQDEFADTATPPVNAQDVPDAVNTAPVSAEQDRDVNRERSE